MKYIDKRRLLFQGGLSRADKTTVHNNIFIFLSSDDVSKKYIITKAIQKTAIEYSLSNVFDSAVIVNNKIMYSKHVMKNMFIYDHLLKKIQSWEAIVLMKYRL